MHATLLIKNISWLYTCNKEAEVLQNAYIALYHDQIIAIGQDSYKELLDPCTRIIDARGEIVVPGFIDCNFIGSRKELSGDKIRDEKNALYSMYKNGILTVLNQKRKEQDLKQDFLIREVESEIPILSYTDDLSQFVDKDFCLSCCFGRYEKEYASSMQPIAYDLLNLFHVEPTKILCAMTSIPANAFGLDDRGSIEVGKRGDLLVIHAKDLDTFFRAIGNSSIHRIVKNGIPVYPDIIRC
ncbi:MAG: amidohydrolase family protein [Firmicutes bacterium]|nr:amidohydrolase family protein [Bacillota bacterium]